jgi:hypothetical protein
LPDAIVVWHGILVTGGPTPRRADIDRDSTVVGFRAGNGGTGGANDHNVRPVHVMGEVIGLAEELFAQPDRERRVALLGKAHLRSAQRDLAF